ncbi:cytochrome c-type biogenesis protein CcmH [Grimontia hollisae]|uniref:Cytochrome c-type biogenesis protein n=2 Tax=Grimontia hollisae TaxID=673 RepID=D0IC66_GRIHO|nr:cytochrome c-type biogenesis protein [Grimontia hollisae]AMG29859.1 cytochrome c-type biogenesis protein CcmH [Grimontia hollisae]EEY71484.1 cytochrome c heme lyase subunit CcmL [Grimontia hollisae CIP 101886]MDF2185523.1 cytochrome c-type biogenesis protein CcmH [Grimontia hollisae]STO43183.1 Cytochrome c-type biogenesis protein CcmH precursor [Grimontia hollisae]STO56840.1 Cytochrome c-type biogenesis protein CcmH precursor [Grimontia hollisae]
MKRFLLAILLAAGAAFSVSAAIEIYEFDTPEQEEAFKKLGKELRCPKCQNNNIADSNSGLAQDLRLKVYEMLKQGKNEDEIVDYMVARYGNFVTYNPPLTASTFILWAGPALFVIVGFTVLVMRSRKPKAKTTNAELGREELARLDALLNEGAAQNNNKDNNG